MQAAGRPGSRAHRRPAEGDGGVTVQLTGEAPDPICSVVELVIEGAPEVLADQAPPPVKSDRGGL